MTHPASAAGLRRCDAIVLGAALLVLIFSFLPQFASGGYHVNLWHKPFIVAVLAIPVLALVCAGFVLLDALLPQRRTMSLLGLSFAQWRNAAGLVAALASLFNVFVDADELSYGGILMVLAGIGLASGIVLGEYVPSLRLPLVAASAAPSFAGYEGAKPEWEPPAAPSGRKAPIPAAPTSVSADVEAGESFWACFPSPRVVTAEGDGQPVGEVTPNDWYLVVSLDADGAVLEMPDGRPVYLDDIRGMVRAQG